MSFLLGNRGFSPDDIVSLAHWYDATKLTGFSDGNSVGTWPDEEGTDDLTQSTGSKQPTYQTNVIGGETILRFDGSDDVLDGAFTALSQPNHVFAVFSIDTIPTSNHHFIYDTQGETTVQQHALGYRGDSPNAWRIHAGTRLDGGTPDLDNHISTALFNGASSVHRIDGTEVASGDAGGNSLDGLSVGAGDTESNHADVDVGEVLVYDTGLSDSDRDDVESYLSDKWGIAI